MLSQRALRRSKRRIWRGGEGGDLRRWLDFLVPRARQGILTSVSVGLGFPRRGSGAGSGLGGASCRAFLFGAVDPKRRGLLRIRSCQSHVINGTFNARKRDS